MATYGSAAGVQAIIPAVGTVSTTTTPTTAQQTVWLAEGYSEINRYLAAAGYGVPATADAAIYATLTALNDLYAAAYTLRARGMDVIQGREENRSETMLKDFFSRLKTLAGQDLTALGLSFRTGATLRRRRVRTMQIRRVDGYSGAYEGAVEEYGNPSE